MFIHCPKKFFKIHRIHPDMTLLWRYYNILYIFTNRHQRSCFHIMEAAICNQIFYCSPCSRKQLYLIEYDQGLLFIKGNTKNCWQIHKERIQIIQAITKQILHFITGSVKINQNIRFIILFCKFFCNIALSDPPGSIDQQRSFSGAFFFPFEHLIQYFSPHWLHLFKINPIEVYHFFKFCLL